MSGVMVRLYSVLQRLAGTDVLRVETSPGVSVGRVLEEVERKTGLLSKARELGIEIIVLDDAGRRLHPHDRLNDGTLHLIPPPSGGDSVSAGIIDPAVPGEEVVRRASSFLLQSVGEMDGAIFMFVGVVRRLNRGTRVRLLRYEDAGKLTEKKIRELAEWAAGQPGVSGVVAYHYKGDRRPGEVTMVVGVAGVDRRLTMPVFQELIERIKHELPIWKYEIGEDESYYIIGDKRIHLEEE